MAPATEFHMCVRLKEALECIKEARRDAGDTGMGGAASNRHPGH